VYYFSAVCNLVDMFSLHVQLITSYEGPTRFRFTQDFVISKTVEYVRQKVFVA